MLKYFVKRFLAIIPKILVISMLIFWGMQLIPDLFTGFLPRRIILLLL